MATAALSPTHTLTVEEYLTTSYRPDCDYVDGELLERNVGEYAHGTLQGYLYTLFFNNGKQWQLRPITEQRVQVSPTRFRIPDVCVIASGIRPDGVFKAPPVLCIEILSPGDSLSRMSVKIDDYLKFGVRHVWLIDPVERLFWTADRFGIHPEKEAFRIEGTDVIITIDSLSQQLDAMQANDIF